MPLFVPLFLAAAGLGSIGFGVYDDMKPKAKPSSNPKSPEQPPPELMAAVTALIQNGTNPKDMEDMAVNIEAYGYSNMAAELRARAAQLRQAQAQGKPPPPPAPLITMVAPTPTRDATPTATLTGTGVNMRSAPSTTASVLASLNKPEIVTVLNWNAATAGGYQWAQVKRSNGAVGFVAKNYLALNGPAPTGISGQDLAFAIGATENDAPRPARCVAPSGCRLRNAPKPDSGFKALVANGERVTILKHVPGAKAERRSPGLGGWALVRAGKNAGWVPSEWLLS